MLQHFHIGIAVRNAEEMHKIYDLIMAQYPEAKGTKSRYVGFVNHIDLPLVRIQFFYLSPRIGSRYDIIYAPDNVTDEEKFEMLYPMILSRNINDLKTYSDLYKGE